MVTLSEVRHASRGPALRTRLLRRALPVALVLGAVTVPALPAGAQDACLPAAGAADAPAISDIQTQEQSPEFEREVATARLDPHSVEAHDVVFSGGGWGHGVGMSQWGAQGAALSGCDAETIVGTYFPGTTFENRSSRSALRLKLWTTGASGWTSIWVEEPTTWRTCTQNDDAEIVECSTLGTQAAGTSLRVTVTDSGWRLKGEGVDREVADRTHTLLQLRHDGDLVRVRQDADASAATGRPIRYGHLELDYTGQFGGRYFTTQVIEGGGASGRSAMETYLLGLAEVPFGWEPAALQAQVIAARSYAEATASFRDAQFPGTPAGDQARIVSLDCRCDLRVTTGDQVWDGAATETSGAFDRWSGAVDATKNRYVVADGNVVSTFYSSSHGGYSADGHAIGFTGVDRPWYGGVDATRWEARADHGRFRWSQGLSLQELQSALGVEDIDGIRVAETDAGDYPLRDSVEVITVVDGQEQVVKRFSPNAIRTSLGLLSPRFVVHEITDLADDDQIPVARLDGETRIDTAIRLSADGWSEGARTVVLARADNPADALTGSSLAGTHDAPLLLTAQDRLSEPVAVELQRLQPERVLLLGGPVALGAKVAEDVRGLGIPEVRRVSGETRFGTAVDVATQVARGDETTAYLVRLRDVENPSRSWVDALSVAGVAARKGAAGTGWPILGTDARLPDETVQAIEDLGITRVVPVGGPLVVSDDVLAELAEMGVEVADRLAGEDRYGTSRAVTASDDVPTQSLAIATGENFPDGLAAGPWAARTGAGLLLVPTELADGTPWRDGEHPAFIDALGWAEPQLFAVGGPVAIETPVISRVATLLEDARPGE